MLSSGQNRLLQILLFPKVYYTLVAAARYSGVPVFISAAKLSKYLEKTCVESNLMNIFAKKMYNNTINLTKIAFKVD
jgi:hypothetical protein